jgi:predicted O-methyltransferase YrrM
MDDKLFLLLENLARIGEENDARETARPKQLLNITHDTGRFLWILVRAIGAQRILEIGTSNAFSTIWLADAASSIGGRVTTLESNPEKVALARANLADAGLDGVVDIIEGRAVETLASLSGLFDLAFLDADRRNYITYLDLLVPKLRVGGMLITDNATSHSQELQDFLRRVKSHPNLFSVTVPIGKGEEIALKIRDSG